MALQLNYFHVNKNILFIQKRGIGKFCSMKNLKGCYEALGISEDSEPEKIKEAYINLAKKYHPDTKSPISDPNKFAEIDKAYRVLMNKKCREKWEIEEIKIDESDKVFDIKHCAPQHRHYLSYEGCGSGTMFEREKQYTKLRAAQAVESVLNHRMKKAMADNQEKSLWTQQKHDIKTKYGFERVVEDLIQEAMKRGEFNNLRGSGKPLPCTTSACNPYVDFVTHKLNQVLSDNGFTPEWIMLQKEINQGKKNLKRSLYKERTEFPEHPLNESDSLQWEMVLKRYKKDFDELNKKIEKYNLIAPVLQSQLLLINIDKIAQEILEFGQTKREYKIVHHKMDDPQEDPKSIFSLLESFIVKNRRY